MQSEITADLATALAKAQATMKAAAFNKTNPHFKNKYADLASVLDAIRVPLSDNGLSVTQTTEVRESGFLLVTTLRHASGQWIASEYPLPVAAKPQELGSALTYARRYSLSAIACIAADDDDDAEGARVGGQTASAPKARPNNPIRPEAPLVPMNPETGEVSPHAITESDKIKWGGLFVAALNMAESEVEVQQWMDANVSGLDSLEREAPKLYARVQTRIKEKMGSFDKQAA